MDTKTADGAIKGNHHRSGSIFAGLMHNCVAAPCPQKAVHRYRYGPPAAQAQHACPWKIRIGKTSTIQALAKLLDLCVVIEDASLFTGAGWRGRDVTSIVKDVVTTAQDPVQADFAVVVLDEIDKVFVNQADNPSFPAANNFLKLIEGARIQHEENRTVYEMETSNLLFICLGAFDGLEEIIAKRISGGKRIGFWKIRKLRCRMTFTAM